jgi:hypothetical protein
MVAAAAIGLLLLSGCSNSAPMPGENGPTDTSTPVVTGTTPSTASGSALPGLTNACTSVLNAQIAISLLFSTALTGTALTAAKVAAVFGPLTGLPADLQAKIDRLHQAATAAVGKTAVDVAAIVNGDTVNSAMAALTNAVRACTPATS